MSITNLVEVYVQLLDEGIPTFRKVLAQPLGQDTYKLIAPENYNPESEKWQFTPNSVVRCAINYEPLRKIHYLEAFEQVG